MGSLDRIRSEEEQEAEAEEEEEEEEMSPVVAVTPRMRNVSNKMSRNNLFILLCESLRSETDRGYLV